MLYKVVQKTKPQAEVPTKHSVPYQSNPSFFYFWHSGSLRPRTERQTAWISKFSNKWWVRLVCTECFVGTSAWGCYFDHSVQHSFSIHSTPEMKDTTILNHPHTLWHQ